MCLEDNGPGGLWPQRGEEEKEQQEPATRRKDHSGQDKMIQQTKHRARTKLGPCVREGSHTDKC